MHPSCSDSHSPISSQTWILHVSLFYHIFFFCLASIRNCYFLNQTPSKPRGFTSEVSRTQHPADHGPFPSHSESLATIVLRMQPLHQCDLQPEIEEPHRTSHTGTTTRCKTHRRNNSRMKRPQPHPPHRRGTFHRRLQPLYTEKHKVSCAGFVPTTYPTQHSCSHSNAICNQSFKKRIELHTHEQAFLQNT